MTIAPFTALYVGSVWFTCSFWAQVLLVPLFALQHGYSLGVVGLLAAVTGLLQLTSRLLAGVAADTWGEVPVIRLCYAVSLLGALPLLAAHPSAGGLVVAEACNGIGRGMYWIAAQSYASRLPGERSLLLGRLQGTSFIGACVALFTAGAASQAFGYRPTFAAAAVLAAAALVLACVLLRSGPRRRKPAGKPFARYAALLRRRSIRLAACFAFASAVPYALVTSFFPAFALHLGLPRALATPVVALCNLSSLATSTFVSSYLRRLGRGPGLLVAALTLACALAVAPAGGLPVFMAAVAAAGLAGGILSPSYQLMAADGSAPEERGAAMSITGVHWSFGMLAVPAAFGFLAQRWGFPVAFGVWGAVELILALAGGLVYLRSGAGLRQRAD